MMKERVRKEYIQNPFSQKIHTFNYSSLVLTERRIRSSVSPRASRTSEGMLAWDMKHGRLINDFTLPKLTVMLKSLVDSAICLDTASEPVLKLRTEPAPLHWIDIQHTVLSKTLGWHCSLNTRRNYL
jgi:hypothetical protein